MSKMFKNFKINFKDIINSFIYVAIFGFIIDILTKNLAFRFLKEGVRNPIKPFDAILNFTLVFNKGAAFGIGGSQFLSQLLLCILSYVSIGVIIYFYLKAHKDNNLYVKFLLMLILGGDIGNLVDRSFALLPLNTIYSKGVIDFIDVQNIIPGFGIFNLADAFICVGIFLLVINELVLTIKNNGKE